jgi:type VI secretion system secreted protein Hcp
MSIAAMTLKLTGITGESLADGHIGEIDVVSWGWGLQGARYLLGDGTPGSASAFNEVMLVKLVDRATPALFLYCDTHKVINSATLTVEKASGTNPLQYLTLDMGQVRILDVEVRSEEAELREHVRLSCETLTMNYTPQASTGAAGTGPISFTADHTNK